MNTRKVEIKEGLKVNVFDSGLEKDYPPNKTIVFIHGGAGCLLNWRYQLPYFSKKYRTIAYDWRGCGNSDNAESYTFDNHYTDFLAVLKALKVPPGPTLVAHSYGCSIALRFINQHQIDKFVNAGMCSSGKKGSWFSHLPRYLQTPIYKYLLLPKNPTLAKWLLASTATPINRVKEFLNDNKIPEMDFFLDLQTFREEGSPTWVETKGKILLIGGERR